MKSKHAFIVILSVLLIGIAGCTPRVVYKSAVVVPVSPDAININTATSDELERLPGIGRKTADAIVEYRVETGAFRRPEHIMQIRGISERRFLEIRHLLKIE